MLLSLAYYPDQMLLKKAERVNYIDDSLRQLVRDMIETMHANRGIGLAAPQIFQSLTLFVSCVPYQGEDGKWFRGRNRVFINPEVISVSSEMQLSEEGCLSIPNIPVKIQRPASVQIKATNLTGYRFEETLEGLFAANFLHEYDHLNGALILDYLTADGAKKLKPFSGKTISLIPKLTLKMCTRHTNLSHKPNRLLGTLYSNFIDKCNHFIGHSCIIGLCI